MEAMSTQNQIFALNLRMRYYSTCLTILSPSTLLLPPSDKKNIDRLENKQIKQENVTNIAIMDEVLAIFNSATEAVKKYTPSISWDPNVSYDVWYF